MSQSTPPAAAAQQIQSTTPPERSPADFTDDVKLKQYQLYVDTAEKVSDRRAAINRFFVTIHTSLVTALAIVGGYGLFMANGQLIAQTNPFLAYIQAPVVGIISILGISLCLVWRVNIVAYKKLNDAKYDVILAMEKWVPFQVFGDEWGRLAKIKYARLAGVELVVPWLCLLLYVALFVTYFAALMQMTVPIPHFG